MDVSIIIVNYNTSDLLKACIQSIHEKTVGVDYEIIVVDNASVDQSVQMVEDNFIDINLIKSAVNLGFGKANNLGVKHANGKYVFLLNTDILLINNAIEILFKYMETPEAYRTGACGGNLYKRDLSANFSYSTRFPSLLNIFLYRSQLFNLLKIEDYFNHSSHPKKVAIIIGADLFMKRALYIDLGGFDPDYFMYIEDGDLAYRIKKLKLHCMSIPEAKIIHLQGKSSTTSQKLIMELKGYTLYFKKHHSKLILLAYLSQEWLFASLKYLVFKVIQREDRAEAFKCLMNYIYLKKWKTN